MQQAVRHLAEQLAAIRSGTVSPGLVASVRVAIDGRAAPLDRLATLANQSGRILVRPFEPAHVPAIVRALGDANLAAYAQDPRTIAVTIPPISGEQRAQIAKHVKTLAEDAKIAVRMVRQDERKYIATTGRGSQRVIQEATDQAIAEIESLVQQKLKEIAT